MNDPTVVVACDCMTALGLDLESTWSGMLANRSGVRRTTRFQPESESLQGIAQIAYSAELPASFGELAGTQAALDKWRNPGQHATTTLVSRLLGRVRFDPKDHDPQRVGLLGATVLGSTYSRDVLDRTHASDSKFILNQCANIPLAVAASQHGIKGPSFSVSSACASSGYAILLASQMIRSGLLDCAVVVATEFPISPSHVAALDWIGALYRREQSSDRAYADPAAASRPFSGDRRGFVLAEGAGAVLLSTSSYGEKHGWPRAAVLRGGYANSDADHLTRVSVPNVLTCMRRALENASCTPDDVECVSAHATSTPVGDKSELMALAELLGPRLRRVPLVANKSQLGHSLGAATMLAFVAAVQALQEGVVPPTLNYVADPALPRALMEAHSTAHPHRTTLVNSFGFGGTNLCLVLSSDPATA
ncbi:MAG: beta-ketoacyl-[acyl-carrier-protein] synthase family protein [Polyangiaceae bacterium]